MTAHFNAATYLVDRQVDDGNGHRVAIRSSGSSLTYAQLAERIAAASVGWRAVGLRPEERVMLYGNDRPDLLVALLSVLRCGGVPVPVSTMYTSVDLLGLLRDSRARFLVLGPEQAESGQEVMLDRPPDLDAVVALADPVNDHLTTELVWARDFQSSGGETPPDRTIEDSPALWLYTSGTTGTPKATMHRHGSIPFVAKAYGQGVLGLGPADRCFSAAKLSFAYGLGNSCFLPLAAGATTILDPARPTPETLLRRLVADEPTVFFAVPTIYAALLRDERIPADAFAPVRLAATAGEHLPEELHRRFLARFGVDLVNGLGTTEALHIFLSNRPGRTRPGTTGAVVPGYEVRVLTEDGAPAAAGTPGTLHVRAPSAATGYWARAAATRTVFHGEWINTGDLVVQDEHGDYTVLGRNTDMIKSGALWVSPTEVEAQLLRHPAVDEAAVVAVPDADGLDRVVACVVLADGALTDPDTLISFCRDGLSSFKCPRHVLIVDALPTTRTGKLHRRALRDEAAGRLGSVFTRSPS